MVYDKTTVRIRSRQRIHIASGDKIGLFKGKAGTVTELATVSGVSFEVIGEEPAYYLATVELSNQSGFDEAVDLSLFAFSLTFVRNLTNPALHWTRAYRVIPYDDFETLQSADVFLARTAYYELLLALPQSMQAVFEAEEALLPRRSDRRQDPYATRLVRLWRFISTRVLGLGTILLRLDEAAKDLQQQTAVVDHHLVAEDSDASPVWRTDIVAVQAARFSALQDSLSAIPSTAQLPEESNLIEQILTEIQQPARQNVEQRFERVFRTTL